MRGTLRRRTIEGLASGASGSWGSFDASQYPVLPSSDPNINKQIVPAGAPLAPYVTAVMAGWPDADHDSWYFPTTAAVVTGRANAALDTIIATGDQVGAAIERVGSVGATLLDNFVPIAIGVTVLFFLTRKA